MPFEARAEDRGEIRIYALSGQLAVREAAEFERELTSGLTEGRDVLMLDCRQLEFISSAGVRVLVMVGKRLAADGGSLLLCALNTSVEQMFEVAGFSRLFPIQPTREDGLRWLVQNSKRSKVAHLAQSLLKKESPSRHEPRSPARPERTERLALAVKLLNKKTVLARPAPAPRGEKPTPPKKSR
ncbi:MAG: STAS domain-containing protein [Acidobacteriota bacterium]